LTIHIETGFGLLSFATGMPSLRALRALLEQLPTVARAAVRPRGKAGRARGA
jgi:hypothetical protein